jgi:hypothetical protein
MLPTTWPIPSWPWVTSPGHSNGSRGRQNLFPLSFVIRLCRNPGYICRTASGSPVKAAWLRHLATNKIMTLTGNILEITNKRDDRHQNIKLQVDQVEYITSRKDGHFFQDFEYVHTPDTPLVITGDCLARSTNKYTEPGEYLFQVFDKVGDAYVLNEKKELVITMEHIEEEGLTIMTSATYSVRVSNEEFNQIKKDKNKEKMLKKRKDRKHR